MSLRDSKKDIINTIGAYTSLANEVELPEGNDVFSSLNENKNPLPFLIDMLKVINGSEGVKNMTGELISGILDDIEEESKNTLITQFIGPNEGDEIPDEFKYDGPGYDIPIKDIDLNGMFKTDPSSDIGGLLYGDNPNDFNQKLYESIVADGTEVEYNGLVMVYDDVSERINFRSSNNNNTVGSWFSDFIGGVTLFNKKRFIANLLSLVFGNLMSRQDKSIEQIREEKTINQVLDNLVNEEERYELNDNERIKINNDSINIKNGFIEYNIGCRIKLIPLNQETYEETVNNILDTNNPNTITDSMTTSIESSFANNETENLYNRNKETIHDGFFEMIINFIKFELIKELTTTPQIRTLLSISNTIKNNGIYEFTNPIDDLKKNVTFIKCIIKHISNAINRYIYNFVVDILSRLILPIARQIAREKIMTYINILRSLIRI